MAKIEFQMITKRKVPADLIETFDLQTERDYSMKILTRVKQPWRVEELNIDFPLEVIRQKLFYSTGTRYGLCLARNELLSYAEADYVLILDDFIIISPWTVEKAIPHLELDFVIRGFKVRADQWSGRQQYDRLFNINHLLKIGHNIWFKPRRRKRPPKKMIPEHLTTGYDLFPMKMLREVNGWDIKYDGGWGLDDYDLGNRLKTSGAWFNRVGRVICFLLKHSSHKGEGDGKDLGGKYIYNRETGVKLKIDYVDSRDPGQHYLRMKYYTEQLRKRAVRAPVGLKEVSGLLR